MNEELEVEVETTAVPIADAMEQAQAVLDGEHLIDVEAPAATADGPCWCGITHAPGVTHPQPEETPPVEAAAPTQAELFPPPLPPPFDFEKAYEDLARADQRARLKKGVWESCKRDTKEAREEYDEALEALHTLFQRIDTERRIAERALEFKQPVLRPVAAAAPATTEAEPTTKGGEEQTMSDLEQTIDDPKDDETEDVPEDESESNDAPGE